MKKFFIICIFAVCFFGCKNETTLPSENKKCFTASNSLLVPIGNDRAVYIDENKKMFVLSKSGEVLSVRDLKEAKPMQTNYFWQSSIPGHNEDTLFVHARFIDGAIYYSYQVENGETYGIKPFLGDIAAIVELPCQTGWVSDESNPKVKFCDGHIPLSLEMWKASLSENALRIIVPGAPPRQEPRSKRTTYEEYLEKVKEWINSPKGTVAKPFIPEIYLNKMPQKIKSTYKRY